jgi:3-hydroxybutyryl-CoA dehydratase
MHTNPEYAANTRFGGIVSHGLLACCSAWSALLETSLPGEGTLWVSQTVNFYAPVKPGDVVISLVRVISKEAKGRRVRLWCESRVQDTIVGSGVAEVSVPKRPTA